MQLVPRMSKTTPNNNIDLFRENEVQKQGINEDHNSFDEERLEEIIRSELNLDTLPEEKTNNIVTKVTRIIERQLHFGPLPPSDQLIKYNKIIPNGAERIMKIAEKEQEHKIKTENRLISATVWQIRIGQIFGLIIALTALALGTMCVMNDHDIAGSVLGGAGLTGLVSVFVLGGRKGQDSD